MLHLLRDEDTPRDNVTTTLPKLKQISAMAISRSVYEGVLTFEELECPLSPGERPQILPIKHQIQSNRTTFSLEVDVKESRRGKKAGFYID